MKDIIPYRQIHLDFHTSEQILGVGENFDAKEFADTLKSAHVNSINIFAKCHHGMYYYPTKNGTQHPGLNGFNLLGEQVKVLRENDIRFSIYTCVGWNEEIANNNPDWQQRGKDGAIGFRKTFERGYYSWNDLCCNNDDYKDLLKTELKEEYDLFKPECFWIDIVCQRNCVCDVCISEMKEMGFDPTDDYDIKKHDRLSEIKFCKELYEFIKSLDENCQVYFNSFPYEIDMADCVELSSQSKRPYFSFIDIESLPSDAWGYAHFPMAVNYLNKYEQEVTMMNGKFHMAWGDFGSMRNLEALEYECFRAIANGAKVCVGDQLHPSGKLDPVVYDRIGKVFDSIEKKEPWLKDTRKIADIGVLTSTRVLSGEAMGGNLADEGAYRILTECKMGYDFIGYLDDVEKYKLVILPDNCVLSDEMTAKLNNFTKSGGKILATNLSGISGGKMLLDSIQLTHISESNHDTCYMRFENDEFEEIPQIDHVLYIKGQTVEDNGTLDAKVLANIVPPYFNRTYEHFCSHRQTPPMLQASIEPAILRYPAAIYISNPLFTDYAYNGYKVYKDIIKNCIEQLIGNNMCEVDLPTLSEIVIREKDDGLVVHTLSYAITRKCKALDTIEDKIELVNRKYSIHTRFKPSVVKIVPDNQIIHFKYENGITTYIIDYQCGHNMVFIKK